MLRQKVLVGNPFITQRFRFRLRELLADVRSPQVVNVRKEKFQPSVSRLLRAGDKNAKARGFIVPAELASKAESLRVCAHARLQVD